MFWSMQMCSVLFFKETYRNDIFRPGWLENEHKKVEFVVSANWFNFNGMDLLLGVCILNFLYRFSNGPQAFN